MARTDFGDHEGLLAPGTGPAVPRLRTIMRLAGAVLSVSLVVFLARWGWDLAMLDVRGVPVIHAQDGPMRIQPEETGGEVVSNQGLAVNAIAAGNGAAPAADEVFLAPAPVTLLPDDTPGLPAAVAVPDPPDDGAILDETAEEIADAVAQAVAMETAPDAITGEGEPAAVPRPRPRPENAGFARASAPGAAPVPEPVDPEAIAPGTRLVQFGAFDSPEGARTEWQRLAAEFPALMADKAMVVQPAESGGRAFWRLRALGFADEAEARRFCAAIDASDIHCIPVTQR